MTLRFIVIQGKARKHLQYVQTRSAKKNPRISGTCSLEMKIDVPVLFAVFHSSVFLRANGKIVRCETPHNERHP
jgi:hypothetical protein